MRRYDIHERHPFFEYVRLDDDSVPAAEDAAIDIPLLDMNHSWPNVGHDALVHVALEAAESLRDRLQALGTRVRVLSFDVRRRHALPDPSGRRFPIYLGTGGPGHLDPRHNDGANEWSQGVTETTEWEAPLFRLFDEIIADETVALLAVCHSFGLLCRWAEVARPVLRETKSSGMPLNRLSPEATRHPWFSAFARELPDHEHFRVVDNRLFDLILEDAGKNIPLAFDTGGNGAMTMVELARDRDGVMPRVMGANHHPEIVDREHVMQVLDEKRAHGEVSEKWYDERARTMRELFHGEQERQSRLTSRFTLIEPLRFHLERAVSARE